MRLTCHRLRSVRAYVPAAVLCAAPFVIAATCSQSAAQNSLPGSGAVSAADPSSQSDEFDSPGTLANWQRLERVEGWNNNQLERFDIGETRSGWLTMIPHTSTWYRDYRGILAFKSITGDFVVTTRLRVNRRGGEGPPRSQFSLAGIMLRTPRSINPSTWQQGTENYVFLSLGSADQPGNYQFEVKTTRNSDSQLSTWGAPGGEALIRVVRVGSAVITLNNTGGRWNVIRRYSRPDFPATIQAGLTCYTDWPNANKLEARQHNGSVIRNGSPDLVAQFDYVRYVRPKLPANVASLRLDDPNSVSDAQILQLFGDAIPAKG